MTEVVKLDENSVKMEELKRELWFWKAQAGRDQDYALKSFKMMQQMVRALKPFAHPDFTDWGDNLTDSTPAYRFNKARLTLGDFRVIREAFARLKIATDFEPVMVAAPEECPESIFVDVTAEVLEEKGYASLDELSPQDMWEVFLRTSTRYQMTQSPVWPVREDRIDVIGQNGNEGLHYEAETQEKG